MKFSIHERLILLELLPQESTYSGIMEIQRLGLLVSITGEEAEILEVKHVDGQIQWNADKALTMIVDIPIGEWLMNELRLILREKSRAGKLLPTEASLFEKFILDYE